MAVRAKFKVDAIERHMGSAKNAEGQWVPAEMRSVKMSPVFGNGDPNHETLSSGRRRRAVAS